MNSPAPSSYYQYRNAEGPKRRTITEAEAERIADARVMKALRIDPRYANAESAEAQADAEDTISRETWADIEREYTVTP